ncbi:MAG: molybdopterin-dependent oxidoreductase [Chloroflexi bacterium]|nr:molybdopterin-dependent oxidoreductase [Chloroflexota bacterium]
MARRLTNDLLLALVLAQVATGLAGWALPVAQIAPLYDLHRALGLALLVVLFWKQWIVRRSLARRWGRDRSVVWGILAGVGLLGAVGIGLAWTLRLISFDALWGYSPLNVHVFLGIGLLPFLGVHAVLRRSANRASARVASRRSVLRLAGLAAATLVGWLAIERALTVLYPPDVRLASGSKHAGSFNGNAFTAEIWLFDPVPTLDLQTWRLRLTGLLATPVELGFDALRANHAEHQVQAVLDCTSGWWSEQVWAGVRLLDVLAKAGLPPEASQVTVASVTGHRHTFRLADLGDALLATHLGGEPLSPGHGYPLRLVVPGRRGYQWVKWIERIDVAR